MTADSSDPTSWPRLGSDAVTAARTIVPERRRGPTQLAFDEVAMRRAAMDGVATARVYRWASPGVVSLGYAQSIDVLDRPYCRRHDLAVTRRQTGGGTIYHDAGGEVAFSIAAPRDALPDGIAASYRAAVRPLLAALRDLGVPARLAEREVDGIHEPACYLRGLHPAYDVVVPRPDSNTPRKIAGCAQHRGRDAILLHGSVRWVGVPDRHAGVFADPPTRRAFDDRLASILAEGVSRGDFSIALQEALETWVGGERSEWSEPERQRAHELARTKYASDDWIRHRRPPEP